MKTGGYNICTIIIIIEMDDGDSGGSDDITTKWSALAAPGHTRAHHSDGRPAHSCYRCAWREHSE